MKVWAVVPAKDFSRAKQRLAGILDPKERRELARFMLEHVLSVLAKEPAVAGSAIVTDSPEVGSVAARFGARVVYERAAGTLNEHVDAAMTELVKVGADAALVLMGDLPAVTTFDVGVLVRELEETDVVIAPDERGRQTNALGLRLENRSPTAFGKLDSLRTHCEAAERRGLGLRRIASPTLAFDVDEPEDYVRLRERQRARGGLSTCLYRNRGSFVSDT